MADDDGSKCSLDLALKYAARGWPVYPVYSIRDGLCSCGHFVCEHPGKHPVGFLVPHGFRDATTDEDQIREWFADHNWNIGIATGQISGAVVLDVDPRHGGDQSLQQLNLPTTVEALTGGGGRHLYFSCPATSVGTRTGIAPGLDICGDGGSVITPPSLHTSGGAYTWKAGQGPDEIALAPFPEALRELIEATSRKQQESPPGEAIPEGRRNTTLMSLAGSMRRRGMTATEILAALLVVNAERCTPPLREEEVRQIAARAGRYESTTEDESGGNSAAAPEEPPAAERNTLFRTAAQIATAASAVILWISKPWVAAGAVSQFIGKVKAAGKTTFLSYLVAAILDGEPFLGEPTQKAPVVWLTEQGDVTFREVLRRANLLHRDDLFVLSHHLVAGLPWTEVARIAVAKAAEIGAKTIVVDTLPPFAGLAGDAENRAGDAEAAVRAISDLAATQGIAVILVFHERKSGGDVGDASRGSSAFGGAVDLIVAIRRLDDPSRPTFRLLKTLGRFDETPPELVIELTETGYVAVGTTDDVKEQSAKEAILNALPTDPVDAVTVEQLIEETGIGRTRVRAILRELEASGVVHHVGLGRRGIPRRYFRAQPHPHPADSAAAPPSLRAAAEKLYALISASPTLMEVNQAEAYLRDDSGLNEDEAHLVIEQFRSKLWLVAECLDEGGSQARYLVPLPPTE